MSPWQITGGLILAALFASVWIFLVMAIMRPVLVWTVNRYDAWWSFPLWMSFFVPFAALGLAGTVGLACVGFMVGAGV